MRTHFRFAERLYRALLRLYPAWFVARRGARMLEAFREQRSDPLYGGLLRGLRPGDPAPAPVSRATSWWNCHLPAGGTLRFVACSKA